MTGCPNGCSRPYMAEIGLVGDGPNSYQLYLGGSANQTRLAEVYMERMKMQVLPCRQFVFQLFVTMIVWVHGPVYSLRL